MDCHHAMFNDAVLKAKEEDQASQHINTMSSDLDNATEPWVIEAEGLYKEKVADERDWKLGNFFLQKGSCELGLGEISSSNGHNESEVCLDLELKPPCNPQPKFSWSDDNQAPCADIIDLTLSLVGNPVKPQQCDGGGQETMKECDEGGQETMKEQLYLQKSSFVCVESEAYEGDGPFKATEHNHLVSDKDLNVKFDTDLNSVCIDSDDGTNTPNNSSKPLEANEISDQIAKELVSQDQLADNSEAGHTEFKRKELNPAKNHNGAEGVDFVVSEGNKIAALDNISNDNCSSFSKIDSDVADSDEEPEELVSQDQLADNSEAGHIEFKRKELNPAKNHIGADGVDFVVSEGNKIAALDNISNDNCSSFSKIDSDVADSDEEPEEYEEVFECGSCDDEEPEEYEEVFEDGSCDNEEPEEKEEAFEDGSCDNESDSSHNAVGAADAGIKEYEGVMEEVSCDAEADNPSDEYVDKDAGFKEYVRVMEEGSCDAESDNPSDEYVDEESREVTKIDDQKVERIVIQSQDDAREKQIQDHKEYIDKRKVDATVPGNLQHLAPDAPTTREKRLIKSGFDKDIAEDLRWKHIQTSQECIDKREYVVTQKAKRTWGAIPDLDKVTADATEEIIKEQEWGTKSGINKDIADSSESIRNEIDRRGIARKVQYAAHSQAGTRGKEKLNMEEVSCAAESDNPSAEFVDKESRKVTKMDDQKVERTMIQSQDDAREKQIQDHKEYIDKRKVDVTVPLNLQRLAPDAPTTMQKRLIKFDLDKDIAEDVRGKHIQTPQECIDKREYVVTRKAKRTWGAIPGLDKDTADATEEMIKEQEWGTKSGINKDIADSSESIKNEIGRRGIARKVQYGAHSQAGTRGKEKLNVGPDRPSYKNQKLDHGRPISSRIKREKFPNKSFRRSRSGRHRDDRRNERYLRSDNDRERVIQIGKRRSDYTWVREDHVGLDNAAHCEGTECAGEEQIQNICDSPQMPRDRKRNLVAHDLPDCSVDHFSFSRPSLQYLQTGDVQRKTSESPNMVQSRGAQQYNFGSSSRSLENPSTAWLGAPQKLKHEKMQSSYQDVYYSHDSVVPSHASVHEDARGINPNAHRYSTPLTPLQKSIKQRSLDIYPRQAQRESFRHSQYIHGGEPRLSAEFDMGCYGVENNLRHARYEGMHQEIEERRKPRESERNLRNRLGETSNGARSARENAGNSRFRGEKGWPDAEFSNGMMKRTKY